ncbi:hypothetical protein Nepgr_000354 [Nepenthes gracilis]|uniref:Lysosomal Pro-Xaa carboxypeptidase n=1 Tax=Nepenthes gracilis TaxID=150966 RepID=A0AAD3P1Q4_NEPGR|nr:hypothetical protein Nepgr_000354 [Nepenthes gracilis]
MGYRRHSLLLKLGFLLLGIYQTSSLIFMISGLLVFFLLSICLRPVSSYSVEQFYEHELRRICEFWSSIVREISFIFFEKNKKKSEHSPFDAFVMKMHKGSLYQERCSNEELDWGSNDPSHTVGKEESGRCSVCGDGAGDGCNQGFTQHRFYGKSIPFGLTMEEVMKNATLRGYFNSAQALQDYAEVIIYLKQKLHAHYSPVIVIGGSYGGMLASWFRMKYPHVALGALASSAPILYFDDITPEDGYYSVVTQDFRETSESCYESIRKSWGEIDNVASKHKGLLILSNIFKTCSPLNNTTELKDYLDSIYASAAQYGRPPTYSATKICNAIDDANNTTDILHRIHAGVAADRGARSCYDTNEFNQPSETNVGWRWQTCSEMVMPIGYGIKSTMFPSSPFDLNSFIKSCRKIYGVSPRPHWITSYYGGHGIKLILRRFASNIIFSNGLRDPYSSAGVLENISDTVVAIYTDRGSHCMDILPAGEGDPDWLVMQRKKEVEMILEWIQKYSDDLHHIYHLQ